MADVLAIDSAWKPVKIGAGGWVTGIDVAPDGTMVARTDTYGAYVWNGTGWNQLLTASSMPSSMAFTHGVYEIRIAPSNTNIFYMELEDGIYKTVDKGQTWTKTSFSAGVFDANGTSRMDGSKLAIDPSNSNVVFAGTQHDGLWVTRDGGSSWQKITAVPQGTNTNDPALAGITIQGSNVYVGTAGSGVYTSADGGVTWKAIGGPVDVANAVVAPDGSYYAVGRTDTALWKYSGGTWTKLIANTVHTVAIDPFNPSHVLVTQDSGNFQESKDAGATWGGWNWGNQLESTNDVAWLEHSGPYMSSGNMIFDPLTPGKVWQSTGVGVWDTQLPSQMNWDTPIVWNSHSEGIEQLVANEILAPAGTDPIFASWDRAFFSVSDVNAYTPTYSGGEFSAGWSVDYASSDSKFIVGLSDWWGQENSGFSSDGGKTWQKFAGYPSWAAGTIGGAIAASTPQNFIWAAAGNQPPAYTLDGGKTWTNISIAGITDWSGVQANYYLERTAITADRVQPNTFYLYDTNSGLYRTTDGGAHWTKVYSGQIAPWSYWNAKIESVPGMAGELFFTSGPQGSSATTIPGTVPFMHSSDGGATWTEVKGVGAISFGFGAAATPGGPSSIYVVGTVNGVYGIWYSTDDAATWTQIGSHPMGSLDTIKTISGDMDVFGRVYVGFSGSGYSYLDIPGSPAATTPPPTTTTSPTPSLTAPTAQAVISDAYNDAQKVGIAAGSATNDKTPVFHGTLSTTLASDQSVVIFRDGQKIGVATVSGSGWTFTDPGAADGTHSYTAQVQSSNGVSGLASAGFSLKIDTTAPTQTVAATGAVDDVGPVTGTLANGATTDDKAPVIKGTLSAALGSDETLVVYRDGVKLGAATVSGSSWSFADSNVTDGQHSYVARVEDAAGNQGQSAAAFSLQVKTTAPTTTSAIALAVDDFGSMKGNLASGAVTDDTSPLLKGTLSGALNSGEQLVVYRDGVRLGAASVSGTDWSYADKGVSKGMHVYTSQVEDASGLKSAASAGFYLTLSTSKGVKAGVMSSYSLTGTSTAIGTADTSVLTDPVTKGSFKFNLSASDLIDTSKFASLSLSLSAPTADGGWHASDGSLTSKLVASMAATETSLADHSASHMIDSGVDLVGNNHHVFGHMLSL